MKKYTVLIIMLGNMMGNLMHGMQPPKTELNLAAGTDIIKRNLKKKFSDRAAQESKDQQPIEKSKLEKLIATTKKKEKELNDQLQQKEKQIDKMVRESWYAHEVQNIQTALRANEIILELLTGCSSRQLEQEDNQEEAMRRAIEEGDYVNVLDNIDAIITQKKTEKESDTFKELTDLASSQLEKYNPEKTGLVTLRKKDPDEEKLYRARIIRKLFD